MQRHRYAPARDARCVGKPEHLLQLHRQHRRLTGFVFELELRTARHRNMCGRVAVELLTLLPIKVRLEHAGQIEAREMIAARDAVELGGEPAVEAGGEAAL